MFRHHIQQLIMIIGKSTCLITVDIYNLFQIGFVMNPKNELTAGDRSVLVDTFRHYLTFLLLFIPKRSGIMRSMMKNTIFGLQENILVDQFNILLTNFILMV